MVAPNEAESQLADLMPCPNPEGLGQKSQWGKQRVWVSELSDYLGCEKGEVLKLVRSMRRVRKLVLPGRGRRVIWWVTPLVAAQVIIRIRMRQGAHTPDSSQVGR